MNPGNSRVQSYGKHLSWEIPYCVTTAPIGPFYKSESRDSLNFETRSQNTAPGNDIKPHGLSMYTLSLNPGFHMLIPDLLHLLSQHTTRIVCQEFGHPVQSSDIYLFS